MLHRLLTTGVRTTGFILLACWPLVCVALWRPHETVRLVRVPAQPGLGRVALSPTATPRPLPCAHQMVRHHVQPGVTVIDVAGALAPQALPSLLRLAPGERVAAVDDRAVASDLEAGARIAASAVRAGEFVDVTLQKDDPDGNSPLTRRVLLLRH